MPEVMAMTMAWAAGLALGGFFFLGLWWTVRWGLVSPRPALLFLASVLLRMGVTLGASISSRTDSGSVCSWPSRALSWPGRSWHG